MAFYRGPNIVRNGLVLCLDAASKRSYPGSGTTWTDLSGLNNNGTLTNGPTFSNANGGILTFNGTSQHISGSSNSNFAFGTSNFLCCLGTSLPNSTMPCLLR